MKYSIVLFYLLSSLAVSSQIKPFESAGELPKNEPVEYILCGLTCETDAEISYAKWKVYLLDNLVLDSLEESSVPAGTYKLTVHFIIDTAGMISNVKVLKDPGYGLGNKISQVLCANKILWKPAERNGRKIKSYKVQLITFIIDQKECEEKLPTESML